MKCCIVRVGLLLLSLSTVDAQFDLNNVEIEPDKLKPGLDGVFSGRMSGNIGNRTVYDDAAEYEEVTEVTGQLEFMVEGLEVVKVIPDMNFESRPPAPMCEYGFGGGFERALGLPLGYTENLGNLVNIQSMMALVSQVTPTMDQATKKIVQLIVNSIVRPWSEDEESTALPGGNRTQSFADAVSDTEKQVQALPEADRWEIDTSIGSESPYAALAQRMYAFRDFLQQGVVVVQEADLTEMGNKVADAGNAVAEAVADAGNAVADVGNRMAEAVADAGRGLVNGAANVVRSIKDLIDLWYRIQPTAEPEAIDTFVGFVESPIINVLVQGLLDGPHFNGKALTFKAPLVNVGETLCRAADAQLATGNQTDTTYICTMITAIGEAIGCQSAAKPNCATADRPSVPMTVCNRPPGGPQDPATAKIELKLNPVASVLTNQTLIDQEGLMAYWLFRAVQATQRYAVVQSMCGLPPPQVAPGWRTVMDLRANEPGANLLAVTGRSSISLGLVAENEADSCDLLVVLRGTQTDFEWALNFDGTLFPLEAGDVLGGVHSGFWKLASVWLPALEREIQVKGETCDALHIMITGHSLGGGVAEILALFLAAKYEHRLKLDLVTFAAPSALDYTATETLRRSAEVRSWFAELDAIPKLPCASKRGLPRCDSRTAFGFYGVGYDNYAEHINGVEISQQALGKLNPKFIQGSWGEIGVSLWPKLQVSTESLAIPSTLQFVPNHVCSYACYLSATYCVADPSHAWMCQACAFT